MASSTMKYIFVVDDELRVAEAIKRTLDRYGFITRCFANAAECLDRLDCKRCDLLITDVVLPGMDGISLLKETKRRVPGLPILLISGHATSTIAVRAFKEGAVDFLEKPLLPEDLVRKVKSILLIDEMADPSEHICLTKTEVRILRLILEGKTTKEIARLLLRSRRTIENHRYNMMRKVNVKNTTMLVSRAIQLGLAKYDSSD